MFDGACLALLWQGGQHLQRRKNTEKDGIKVRLQMLEMDFYIEKILSETEKMSFLEKNN